MASLRRFRISFPITNPCGGPRLIHCMVISSNSCSPSGRVLPASRSDACKDGGRRGRQSVHCTCEPWPYCKSCRQLLTASRSSGFKEWGGRGVRSVHIFANLAVEFAAPPQGQDLGRSEASRQVLYVEYIYIYIYIYIYYIYILYVIEKNP